MAGLATFAFFVVDMYNTLTYYTKVVKIGLYTVVRTTADGNLEFVGEFYRAIAFVEAVVYFFGNRKSIQLSVTASAGSAWIASAMNSTT